MSYSVLSVTKMTVAQLATYTGVEGMIVINTDTDSIHVLDGAISGGYSLPNENTVQNYVNTQVSSIMASGGQILPGAATTAGSVVTWDGGAWQEDASFAQTTYVDNEISNLRPSTPSGAGQALQWDGTQFVNVTMTGGGGGGTGVVPSVVTPAGSVLTWDGSAYQNTTGFALSTDVTTAVTNLKGTVSISHDTLGKMETTVIANTNDISTINTNLINYASKIYVDTEIANLVGSASSAYDTLKEIEDFVVTNSSNIGTVLTNMATKAPIPAATSLPLEVLQWDGSAFTQKDISGLASKPASDSLADEVLAWDTASGGFIQKDLSGLAPIPPTRASADTYLFFDGTTFQYGPSVTGAGGSSLVAPALATDHTSGSEEVLTYDGAGNLVNTASPFAVTPPSQSTSDTYLYHDGTSWQYGTPVGTGPSFTTPIAGTASSEVLKWNLGNNEFENVALSVAGFTDMGSITPPSASASSDVLQWDGVSNQFINQPGFATQTFVSNKMPASPTGTNDVVKYDGTSLVNVTLSSTGFTTTGFITPATTSGPTDALQWDGSNFVNTPGFAQAPPTQSTANTYLYHDGTSWQYGTPVSSGSSFGTPAADTVSGEMLSWTNAGGVQNVTATSLGLATETYVDSAISNLLGGASTAYDTLMEIENYITNNADANMTQLLSDLALKAPIPTAGEVTSDGEFLGWDGSAFTKKSVSVQGGAFNLTEVNGEIVFDPNYAVIDAATGVFDFVDNGTEYIIRVKPSLAA